MQLYDLKNYIYTTLEIKQKRTGIQLNINSYLTTYDCPNAINLQSK